MNKFTIICSMAVVACRVAIAETIDLAGVGANATLLDEDAVYVNSSETTASLVFDTADTVAFAGTIQGNITVVKQGSGELTLTGANTYSGGTYVNDGWLKVSGDGELGGGAVKFGGGNLRLGANWTPSTSCITLDEDAIVDTGAYDLTVKPETFVTAGRTMTKIGSGKLIVGKAGFTGENVDGARWIIDGGCIAIIAVSDPFGGAYGTNLADFELELHEDTYLVAQNHMPLPAQVVLRGAEMRGAKNDVEAVDTSSKWRAFSFNGTLTVEASLNGKSSAISASAIHMGNQGLAPTIVVKEGAELVLNTSMVCGYMNDVTPTSGSFVKRGAGTLTIAQPGAITGVARIEDGTVRFGKDGGIGKDASLIVDPSAKIVLDDGAVLDCRYGGDNLLSAADIWIDASTQVAGEGASVYSIANKGRCGGYFVRRAGYNNNSTPAAPTYSSNALNGRPAFRFNGEQALATTSYTNTSSAITVFAVARCTHWASTSDNNGKWASYFAMHSATSSKADSNVATSMYHQDGGGYNWYFGSAGAINLDHNATVDYLPVIDSVRRNGKSVNAKQYVLKTTGVTSKTANKSDLSSDFDISLSVLGCRIGNNGKLVYYGSNDTRNRCFYGDIGEILVFSRYLTDVERDAVNEYLSRKWFGVTDAAVTASIYSESAQPAAISVPNGTATLATPQMTPGILEKKGAGTLQLNSMSGRHEMRVREGTLSLMPTSVVARIDVWMDAADESTVTTNANGRIATIRNKGNSGGVFSANPSPKSESYGAPTPMWEISGINSLPSLKFSGDSALALDSYVNTNAYGFMSIFMVAERSPEFDGAEAGKGKWSSLISMISKEGGLSDNAQPGAFLYEESPYNKIVSARLHRGNEEVYVSDITNKTPNASAFVFSAYLNGYNRYYAFESLADAAGEVSTAKSSFDYDRVLPLNIDFVQIGCRLDGRGKPFLYGDGHSESRAWYGRVGEVIICSAALSDIEKSAILGYLRKKWMNKGTSSGEVPAVLIGTTIGGTLGADTALELSGDTTIASGVATQPIASLAASGAAMLARSGVVDPEGYSMFDIAGDVTLPASMTFRADDLPSGTANIFTYGGTLTGSDTQWTVVSGKIGPHIINANGAVQLIPYQGFMLMIK